MFNLFKKKEPVYFDLENYDYSSFARDMTEEELLTVNGGKQIANSNEAVAGAEVGDKLQRNDGTIVTITQADIDWAKDQVDMPDSSSGTTATDSGSSTSSTGSESSNDRPKDQGNSSSSVGGKVNLGAGNMTVTDYIAQQRKKGAGATVPGQAVEVKKPEGQAAVGNTAGEGNLTDRGYPSTTESYPDAYKTSEKTGAERIKEAIDAVGEKKYIRGVYQCDQYVNEVVRTAGFDPSDYFLDDPTGKLVDEHIKDLKDSKKIFSKTADWLLPGAYVVFMSDNEKEKDSHAALLMVENGSAYIQDNSSHNNAIKWNEYGKAIAWAGGTEQTDGVSAKDVCDKFTKYDNFYFQRIY